MILGLCFKAEKVRAQLTYVWSGGASGSWNNAANWKLLGIPGIAYPGQFLTSDIAQINTANSTVTFTGSLTISALQIGTVSGANIASGSSSASLTISSGFTTGQPSSASTGLTFSGTGYFYIGGTSTPGYQSSIVISSGTNVYFKASSTFDISNNQGNLTNNGKLSILTGSTFKLDFKNTFSNTGTVNSKKSTFTLTGSGTGSILNNTGTFRDHESTFSITGQNSNIQNTGSSANFYGSGTIINFGPTSNNGHTLNNTNSFKVDSGSTISMTTQSCAITNTGSAATFTLDASTLTMSTSNTVNITNSSGATFTAQNSSTISMSGNKNYISNAGTFYAGLTQSPCTINISGTGNTLGNNTSIINTGTFILASTSVINATGISSSNPNIINNSSGTFTLQSNQYGSATIGALGSGSSAAGTFNVERYFNGGAIATYRGYRLGSSAVNANSITNNTGATALYSLDFLSTSPSSIFTAGPGGTLSGFTSLGAGNSTIYLYREDLTSSAASFNGGNFKGVYAINTGNTFLVADPAGTGSTSTTLPAGNGYMLYYIGDKTLVASKVTRSGGKFADPESSTSTATGTINQGDIPVKIWFRANTFLSYTTGISNYISPSFVRGFNLVGNPYPSSIDWDDFTNGATDPGTGIYGPNLKNSVYVFDYRSKNYGVYQQGTAGGLGTRNSSHVIVSGQGFFVKVDSSKTVTAAKLTFHEGAKLNTQNTGSGLLFKSALVSQLLRIKLSQDSINADDIILTFEPEAKNEYESDKDADYLQGIGSAVSLTSYALKSDKKLAINHMHSIDESTRIKLYASASSSTIPDTLSATGFDSLNPRFDVYLIDHYKKDSIFFSKYKQYLFHVDRNDASSYGSDRFELVFHKNSEYNYHLLGFTAKVAKDGALLTWKVEKETTFTSFTIERNNGSDQFTPLYTVQSNGSGIYTYLDKSPLTGVNTYRLKQVDAFGNVTYSTATLNFNSQLSTADDFYSIYPNPVITQFNIKINTSAIPKQVQVRVTDLMGNTVINTKNPGDNIRVNAYNLMPGAYIVEVTDSLTRKTLGQKKLIKQ
jgi:hypothetical protein